MRRSTFRFRVRLNIVTGRGGEASLTILTHDYFTPTREIRRYVGALARNHPEGWKLRGHVSPTTTNYLEVSAQG